jgi:hypothetical protein
MMLKSMFSLDIDFCKKSISKRKMSIFRINLDIDFNRLAIDFFCHHQNIDFVAGYRFFSISSPLGMVPALPHPHRMWSDPRSIFVSQVLLL